MPPGLKQKDAKDIAMGQNLKTRRTASPNGLEDEEEILLFFFFFFFFFFSKESQTSVLIVTLPYGVERELDL